MVSDMATFRDTGTYLKFFLFSAWGPLISEISIARQFGIMVLYLTSLKSMVRIQNNLTEIILR